MASSVERPEVNRDCSNLLLLRSRGSILLRSRIDPLYILYIFTASDHTVPSTSEVSFEVLKLRRYN